MQNQMELILSRYGCWETEAEKEECIKLLEDYIKYLQEAANKSLEAAQDPVYDTCIDMLTELRPDSPVLTFVWTDDDDGAVMDEYLDSFLRSYPMFSILTIKHMSDRGIENFKSKLPAGLTRLLASIKLNGHAVRIVWDNGHLVKATTRGRATLGRDLTNHMKIILGSFCEAFESLGLVEARCECLLPFDNLEAARKFNPAIKSAFTGVSSMIRASASDEEVALLDIVIYDIMSANLTFTDRSEKFAYLQDLGFKVPQHFTFDVSRNNFESSLNDALINMDLALTDYPYFTDGLVISVDDLELFEDFGFEGKNRLGSLALKMGRWKQNAYAGVVQRISWEEGKTKLTPVAIIEGVVTASGNTVTNVPLYAPLYILMLEAYPGNIIHFRYGGEAGVVPVTPDGRLVTDKDLQ